MIWDLAVAAASPAITLIGAIVLAYRKSQAKTRRSQAHLVSQINEVMTESYMRVSILERAVDRMCVACVSDGYEALSGQCAHILDDTTLVPGTPPTIITSEA